jgi:hypothetical protein
MTKPKYDGSPAKATRSVTPEARAKMSKTRSEWWAKQRDAAPAQANSSKAPVQNLTAPTDKLEPALCSPTDEAQRPGSNAPDLEPGHAEASAIGGDGTASIQTKTSRPAKADSERHDVLARIVYKSIGLPYPYDDLKVDLSKAGETNPARQPSKSVETAAHTAMARTISKMQSRRNKPVVVTDFVRGDGWFIELVRSVKSHLCFILYQSNGGKVTFSEEFELSDRVIVPPKEDELIRHVRLPRQFNECGTVGNLLKNIDSLIDRCLDIDAQDRFMMSCLGLSTWFVDRLPLAPYLALVGLPQSGKTTAMKVLHLLCWRGLLTADISSAAFFRVCDQLMPTLFVDETATAGQQRALFHLLRSGNTPDFVVLRDARSYRTYSAKVVSWIELPSDSALNSRCLIIPTRETSRTDLLRTTDPEIVAAAEELQGQLLMYRFRNYSRLRHQQIPGCEKLRARNRDLYEALALPIADDPEACARLLECMEKQHDFQRQPLPPNHTAVLEALFHQIHVHADKAAFAIRDLTNDVNINLKRAGERFRMNPKGVGAVLTPMGFTIRTRTNAGWVIWIDRGARKRIHELMLLHGVDGLAGCLPSENSGAPCEFCKNLDRQSPDPVG